MGLLANNLATPMPSHLVQVRAVKRNPVRLQQESVSVSVVPSVRKGAAAKAFLLVISLPTK